MISKTVSQSEIAKARAKAHDKETQPGVVGTKNVAQT